MLFLRGKKVEGINNTNLFMTVKDKLKTCWEKKKTDRWMLSFKSKGYKWSSKSSRRTKLQKLTGWWGNWITRIRFLEEILKLSENFKKKSKWRIIKLKVLVNKFKISRVRWVRWWDRFPLHLHLHNKIQTKRFYKNWLDKWRQNHNLKQNKTMKQLWELWLIRLEAAKINH